MNIDPHRGQNEDQISLTERNEVPDLDTKFKEGPGTQTKPDKPPGPKPNHAYATARVYVDGLSIMCCRLPGHDTEIVFVEPHHSPISVEVRTKKACNEVLYSYTAPRGKKVRIEIEKIYAAQHNGGLYFEERIKRDPDDHQWMPDLCDWYNTTRMEFWPNAKDYLSAKLVVKDAIFHTAKRSRNDASWKPGITGKVGRILGGDIVCQPNERGIVMKITDAGSVSFLKDGGPYYFLIKTEPLHYGAPEWNFMDFVYDHIIKLNSADRYYLRFSGEKPLKFNCENDRFDEDETKQSTEYACQPLGGGNGDPPPIP